MRTRTKAAIAIAISYFPVSVCAEAYTCAYRWSGKAEVHPVLIEVNGDIAIERGGYPPGGSMSIRSTGCGAFPSQIRNPGTCVLCP